MSVTQIRPKLMETWAVDFVRVYLDEDNPAKAAMTMKKHLETDSEYERMSVLIKAEFDKQGYTVEPVE